MCPSLLQAREGVPLDVGKRAVVFQVTGHLRRWQRAALDAVPVFILQSLSVTALFLAFPAALSERTV